MILLDSFDPDRKPFTKTEAHAVAKYLLKYGQASEDTIATFLIAKYEQGVRDCHEGIVTNAKIEARHKPDTSA